MPTEWLVADPDRLLKTTSSPSASLTPAQRAERGSYVGCIAGALSFAEYRTGLAAVGQADVSVTPTHAVADGMHSAIIRAAKPAS